MFIKILKTRGFSYIKIIFCYTNIIGINIKLFVFPIKLRTTLICIVVFVYVLPLELRI